MSGHKQIEEIVQDVDKAIRANFPWDLLASGYIVSSADNIAQELYYKGYRKSSEVAREIFEEIERWLDGSRYSAVEIIWGVKHQIEELKKKYTEGGE